MLNKERLEEADETEIRRLLANATPVNAWYAHPFEKQVRGPWCRWFQASGPFEKRMNPPHPSRPGERVAHAAIEDDVAYCAAAMNMVPVLLNEIDRLREDLEDARSMLREK